MTPPRRVLVGIGVLVLCLVVALFVVWHSQTRALGDALVADVQATLERPIEREVKVGLSHHDNGYACLGEMIDVTPKSLSPFEPKDREVFNELLDGGVVPEPWHTTMASLAPWAEAVRSCGASTRLKFVAGVTPFTTPSEPRAERGNLVVLALTRLTRLQARLLAAEGQWDLVAERCAGTLEVSLDRSRLNLLGAMVASAAVRQLTPACGEALQRLSPQARPGLAARFAALPGRLARNAEYLESERQMVSLSAYGWLLSAEQRATMPPGEWPLGGALENPVERFLLARSWPRYDKAMRSLVTAADAPGPARLAATHLLADGDTWWLPGVLSSPDYEPFFQRSEDARGLLWLLVALAEVMPLPPQVTRTAAGLEFLDFKGEKLIIPSATP